MIRWLATSSSASVSRVMKYTATRALPAGGTVGGGVTAAGVASACRLVTAMLLVLLLFVSMIENPLECRGYGLASRDGFVDRLCGKSGRRNLDEPQGFILHAAWATR